MWSMYYLIFFSLGVSAQDRATSNFLKNILPLLIPKRCWVPLLAHPPLLQLIRKQRYFQVENIRNFSALSFEQESQTSFTPSDSKKQ